MRVLVLGTERAASDALRFGAFAGELGRLGVELTVWDPEAWGGGAGSLDRLGADLAASDVVVLRRTYGTWDRCLTCGASGGTGSLDGHAGGHEVLQAAFGAVRPLLDLLEADRGAVDAAVVYDTDDDLLAADHPAAGGHDWLETDLVRRALALADLVTAATPALAARLEPHARSEVRVVRNALDPAWYAVRAGELPTGDPDPERVRVVYHGAASRLPDYEVARAGVDAAAAADPRVRRVWLGGAGAPSVEAAVDEATPWVPGVRAFAAALAAVRPSVGLAPLADTPYNRCRSELHWLEYAAVGAPCVVTGLGGPGPYDRVRDGIDGLVAASATEWGRHIAALAASPGLRADLAGAARERLLAEDTVAARAPEWAAAYADAASRTGTR